MWRVDGQGLWYWDEGRRRRRLFREVPRPDPFDRALEQLAAAQRDWDAQLERVRADLAAKQAARPPVRVYSSREVADRRLLEVGPDAGGEALRAAYRAKVKVMHPDQGGDPGAFMELVAAYGRLSGAQ